MKFNGIVRWRTAGLLLAMMIIVGLPYIVTLSGQRDTVRANAWVIHSNEVKALTYRIAYVIHDSEAASYRLLAGDATDAVRQREIHNALALLDVRRTDLEAVADAQAERLLADHRRVREAADARGRYEVHALKPVDVIALYVLMPGGAA